MGPDFVFSADVRAGVFDLLDPDDDLELLRRFAPGSRLSLRLFAFRLPPLRDSAKTVSSVPSRTAAMKDASTFRLVARSGDAPGAPGLFFTASVGGPAA